jgi:hypothetical protein
MYTTPDVHALSQTLAGRDVLTIYLSAEEHDPARRSQWRARMAAMFDALRSERGGEGPDLEDAIDHLEAALEPVSGFLPGPGWAGFATSEGVEWSGPLAAPTPDLARWRAGPVLAPCLRALKQGRPVALALVDARRARVFRYLGGALEEVADLRTEGALDGVSDQSGSKRAATRSGIRGETATDAAQRALQVETERMVKEVADRVRSIAGDAGLAVVGGTPEPTAAVSRMLAPGLGERLYEDRSLFLTMSAAQARTAVEEAASTLSARMQRETVHQVIEAAGAGGRGAMGAAAVHRAAGLGQVERLVMTASFSENRRDDAEVLIASTLAHGGAVEVVGGEAAEMLDREGGLAARLRFVQRAASGVEGGLRTAV